MKTLKSIMSIATKNKSLDWYIYFYLTTPGVTAKGHAPFKRFFIERVRASDLGSFNQNKKDKLISCLVAFWRKQEQNLSDSCMTSKKKFPSAQQCFFPSHVCRSCHSKIWRVISANQKWNELPIQSFPIQSRDKNGGRPAVQSGVCEV